MKPIAATVGAAGRRDFFWLTGNFDMLASIQVPSFGNMRLGGIFTSVPAAVAAMARREPDPVHNPNVLATGKGDTAGVNVIGVNTISSTSPGVAAGGGLGAGGALPPLIQRLDIFGLGLDYAMYNKRLWGTPNQHDTGPWLRLGGVFTSAPAAIDWAGSRVEVLGVGMDHAMYVKSCLTNTWTSEWKRLGGAFTSAATLVSRGPKRLDAFARGADFTLRGNHTDGVKWATWQNHGGELSSAPVAVSWGPDRVDIFAIFKDGALWHRWWDGKIWNEWESLGGNYTGEPAVTTSEPGRLDVFAVGVQERAQDRVLHHHRFNNETWSNPEKLNNIGSLKGVAESPTVISTAPNRLEIFVPLNDTQIRIGKFDGQKWEFISSGTHFRAPSRYKISVDFVRANTTRALDADTDAAMISVAAGNAPAKIKTSVDRRNRRAEQRRDSADQPS